MATTNSVSSWSKKAGKEIGSLAEGMNIDAKQLAEKAGLNAPRLKRCVEGTAVFNFGEFVMVANALDYTPGGLMARCLKS